MRTKTGFLFLLVMALSGCGGERPAEVTGTVTLTDGSPLAEGEIIFLATDDAKTPEGGPIKDGKYSLSVLPGPKKVQIRASRPPAKADKVLGSLAREPMLGPEFNDQTRLTAEIKPGRNDGINFEVKALPKGR